MSKNIYQNSNPKANQIFNLIGNLENSLSQRNGRYSNYQINNNFSSRNNNKSNKNLNNIQNISNNNEIKPFFTYNSNHDQLKFNNQITNYELRKIIKEEFESLYRPYHKEISNNFDRIRGEINNIFGLNKGVQLNESYNNKYEFENSLNEIKKNLYDYVSFKEYNKKINELEEKINFNNKKYDNVLNNQINNINNINEETQDFKNKFKEIKDILANYEKEKIMQNNENTKLNEIKLKDIMNKNVFLQNDFTNLKDEINKFKNEVAISINDKNRIINELELKYNSINIYDNKFNKINNDLNRMKENMKNLSRANEELKIMNTSNISNLNNYKYNMIDNDVENKIHIILKKLNLTELDINRLNQVSHSYEDLLKNYVKLSKIITHLNSAIIDLNNKIVNINQNNNNYNSNNININSELKADILLINKRTENLERCLYYCQNRVENLSIDAMKLNNNNNEINLKKEQILLMKKDIEKIKSEISNYNITIEKENLEREQYINRIKKIETQLIEENKKKNEINNYLVQLENNINSKDEKIKKKRRRYNKS